MRLVLSLAALVGSLLPLVAAPRFAPNVVTDKPRTPAEQRKAFTLPPGFEIQLVAADPDIQKPMNIAFDDRGRLWITDTVEYPWPVKEGQKGRDTVKILDDFGPDGRARKITTFADGLNIPIGLLPLPGAESALVYSIPHISFTTPRTRDTLYRTYGFADTHGMTNAFTFGFDGWVYACHGFANNSTVKGKAGETLKMNSGNVYRLRADGTALEQFTWGQVNPFGICFDPLGNLYSADCHTQPIYQLLRGGYYPSFGKAHDGLGFAPAMITGFKGSTAIAGIACYAADGFPPAYRGSFFVGDVMTNELLRFELKFNGTTPSATTHEFLRCSDQWFRPVDVKLGPDGALYIADFYNCIIGHYEVPLTHPARDRERGRIWRIVYTGKDAKATAAPGNVALAKGETLLELLAHPNLVVRQMAANEVSRRNVADDIRKALTLREQPDRWAQALWIAHRTDRLTEDDLKAAANADAEVVRVHAMRVLSERPWKGNERTLAHTGLTDAKSANVRRAAADALSRHPDVASIKPLLALRKTVDAKDTHLLHVVRMALRDQLRSADAWKRVAAQRDEGDTDARLIADVTLGVPTPEAAAWLVNHVAAEKVALPQLEAFTHHIARHGTVETRKQLAKFVVTSEAANLSHQAALVRAVARGTQEAGRNLDEPLVVWANGVGEKLLASVHAGEVRLGADLIGNVRLSRLVPRLGELVKSAKDRDTRLAALRALANADANAAIDALAGVLRDAAYEIESREEAATLLARINQPRSREALFAGLTSAAGRLQTGIAARLAQSREGAEALLDAVERGKASPRLLQDRAITVQLASRGLPNLDQRLKSLTAGLPAVDAHVAKLLSARRDDYLKAKPDVNRGAALYEKQCAICHQIAGKGAKIGPQLDGIGLRGLERLLEDTLDPSRNVDQAFRTTTIRTKRGVLVQGLLLRQDGAVLVLADAQGKEVRVKESDIEERSVSNLSPMPANFAEAIKPEEFRDLMAYLLSQRPGVR
jgi:putative heme-binding domain-containing protein